MQLSVKVVAIVCTSVFLLFFLLLSLASGLIGWRNQPPQASNPTPRTRLRLDENNEFHITIFSDLHYGEEEHGWGIEQDVKSTAVMSRILDDESPDFVVFNGDLITGENTFLENSTKYVDVIVKPLVERNLPWASTYGNHDSQYNLSREALFGEESKHSLSHTKHSPSGMPGITNYYLPLYGRSGLVPVAILWFLDSQGGLPFQTAPYLEILPSWVDAEIVAWFRAENEAIQLRWGELPSLLFVHIPPTAFLVAQEAMLRSASDAARRFPGLNDDVPLDAQSDGKGEDMAFMQALVDTPGLHSLYSGHDHGNSWCANWPDLEGVERGVSRPFVCFCKHTGYGGYGTWKRGARNLKLGFGSGGGDGKGGGKRGGQGEGELKRREKLRQAKKMVVDSWVRMESGEIVQMVGLNETYGKDVYAPEDGETD